MQNRDIPYKHGFEDLIEQDDLLLHSLINFTSLFSEVFDVVAPKAICEIGVESGRFSRFLLDYCARRNVRYSGVDTNEASFAAHDGYPDAARYVMSSLRFLQGKRLYHDLFILDGDHNYYTVCQELKGISRIAALAKRQFPVVFVHDTGWPCAFRDVYYAPNSLPPRHVHPFSYGGVTINTPQVLPDGGFRGEGAWAVGKQHGGPRNGVKQAVLDVVAASEEPLEAFFIPAIFGLAVIYAPSQCAPEVREGMETALAPWRKLAPFLALMEYNRLQLYLKVIELQDADAKRQKSEKRNMS